MKRSLVLVPHQDDEINLVGNILYQLASCTEVRMVFFFLPGNEEKALIRKKEALKSCSLFGITEDQVIFYNHPENPNIIGEHYFNCPECKKVFIKELVKLILSFKPDIIFTNDFDYNSDHRALSIGFDTALGTILNNNYNYHPIVYKGFCYETAYYGVEDYKATGDRKTVNKCDKLSNPSFEWESRKIFQSAEKMAFIWNTRVFKALKCHKSQYALLHAKSVINSDNIFWHRRTDNLLYDAVVNSSSGNADYLTDFVILDTDDLITLVPTQIKFNNRIWSIEQTDENREIYITFKDEQYIQYISFRGEPNQSNKIIINVIITIDDKEYKKSFILNPFATESKLQINIDKVKHITVKFENSDIKLTQIEAFNTNKQEDFELVGKISTYKKDNFVINYIDKIGFKIIVFKTKILRKIRKIIFRKRPYNIKT